MTRNRLTRALVCLPVLAVLATAPPLARGFEEMKGPAADDPKMPTVPDVSDITLSADEWEEVQKGEIIVQIVERGEEDRQARAIGYLKHNPSQLFDVATDSTLAPKLVKEVEFVEVLERSPTHKRFHGVADFSWALPKFQYWMLSAYDASRTGQSWVQVKGDLDKNEGSHSFFWDPERKETLVVFTYDMALKGILSLVPEFVVIRIASNTLPDFLRNLDKVIDPLYAEDPPRAEGVAAEWTALKPRLEAGEFPTRVWKRTAPPPKP